MFGHEDAVGFFHIVTLRGEVGFDFDFVFFKEIGFLGHRTGVNRLFAGGFEIFEDERFLFVRQTVKDFTVGVERDLHLIDRKRVLHGFHLFRCQD